MIKHEISRLLGVRPLGIVLCVLVPLLILTIFVPGTTKPVVKDLKTDIAGTATVRFNGLNPTDGTLHDLNANARTENANKHYLDDMKHTWIAFGGLSDNLNEDTGAYFPFYSATYEYATAHEDTILQANYNLAKTAFDTFYIEYQKIMLPIPKIFIRAADYDAFTRGIEDIHNLFDLEVSSTVYTHEETTKVWRVQDKMNKIRRDTHFRAIMNRSQGMFLTKAQYDELAAIWETIETRRKAIVLHPPFTDLNEQILHYTDFCDMGFDYISWLIYRAVVKNAPFETDMYWGYSTYEINAQRLEISRTAYLLQHDLFNMDYSTTPSGLTVHRPFTVMHAPSGTTGIDYIFNGLEVILPALLLLSVAIAIWCVWWDVHQMTVLGSVASPHTRRKIIWAKMFACLVVSLGILGAFAVLLGLFSTAALGGWATPPTALIVMLRDVVVKMSPIAFIILAILGVVAKMMTVILLTTYISLLFWRYRFVAPVAGGVFCVIFFLLDLFLRPFVLYNIIFYPIILVLIGVLLRLVDGAFVKKEYL